MRAITTLALASGLLGAEAIRLLRPRDSAAARVVQHDIQRRDVSNPLQRDQSRLRKRAASKVVSEDLDNEETLYFMSVSVGTPAQDLRLHIDTGSSDLWVNVASSQLCESNGNPCGASGVYSANDSSTYSYINSDFNISYVDGSGSAGDYASDVVRFGGVSLQGQQLGIGYQSSSQQGIIGIGYPTNEVTVSLTGRTYANVPESLVNSGLINTNAYSLWLNDLDANKGSVLFGGVNTAKYTGQLETLPIVPEVNGEFSQFVIALTAVGANGEQGSIAKNLATPALLDSGSSFMYLPNDIAMSVFNAVGARYDTSQQAAFVDCSLANSSSTLDFTFSSPTIKVSMSELVIVVGVDRGAPVCILGMGLAGDSLPVLGDTFIRSAYVVYDIANNEISLAQTNFDNAADNIMEITAASGVPDATVVQNAVTSVAVASDGARNIDQPTITSASAANRAAIAAMGYSVALAIVAGFALLAL